MKKSFLTVCVAFLFLTATAQENPYIVKTRGAKKKAQMEVVSEELVPSVSSSEPVARISAVSSSFLLLSSS